MKKIYLFGLMLLSSCLIVPSNNAKAMLRNIFLGFSNGRPVINKNLDKVLHPSRYASRNQNPPTNNISPLVFDTSHLTGENARGRGPVMGSIQYNVKGKQVILVSDPVAIHTVALEKNPLTGKQTTFKIKESSSSGAQASTSGS